MIVIKGDLSVIPMFIYVVSMMVTLLLFFGGYRIDYLKAPNGDKEFYVLNQAKSIGWKMIAMGIMVGALSVWGMIACGDEWFFKMLVVLITGVFFLTIGIMLYLLDNL